MSNNQEQKRLEVSLDEEDEFEEFEMEGVFFSNFLFSLFWSRVELEVVIKL